MTRPHVVSPAELSSLSDLEFIARTTVEGLRQGLHRSPFHGYSAEFAQYRHYRPGDDLKHVDWKLFGRSDRLYTRQFRETTNLSALLVLDASASMAYPEAPAEGVAPASKFLVARAATAALAALVIDQGDTAGVAAQGRDGVTYLPSRSGRHHLHAILAALARLSPGGAAPVSEVLRHAVARLGRRGLVVVLSDFYDEPASTDEVRRLARMGHEVVVVHVLSPEEVDLPETREVELEDLESGATRVVDPREIRAAYRTAVSAFERRVERAVIAEGLDYLSIRSDRPLPEALRAFLLRRRARGAA
ncbi:MAG: DUF58 domain-containing protein [Vicinamibacterales bacterium]|nr:DUF58 domain-containing protein [Vicinamibacterales bacterium]